MTDPSVGIVTTQNATLFAPPNPLLLQCGRTLGPIDVAYETYGTLSDNADNVIWICHALSGDAHVAGKHSADDRKAGWWDDMVGPGRPIDTDRYFVVCSNILGGCKGTTGPSSIRPDTGQPWGMDFPVVTIADMVAVQRELMKHLGINKLLAVIGGSMGGMQVLEWAASYPELLEAAVPIATTALLSAQSIAFNAVGRHAILNDPDFRDGRYHDTGGDFQGLAIARMIGHITYLSETSMHEKFGRELRNADNYTYDFDSEFSVETYLDYQGRQFVGRFDANSYLYITKAMDYFDLAQGHGSLTAAFDRSQARFLIISFSSDWLFPPSKSRQIVDALLASGKSATYCDIQSPYGHDAFLLEPEVLGSLLRGFLDTTLNKVRNGRTVHAPMQGQSVSPRYDLPVIQKLIEERSRVLDLGCGDGRLLQQLANERSIQPCGVEIQQPRILEVVNRGIDVIQHDLDQGLPEFPDNSFDYVLLSQTLPEVRNPELVVREMLRIGRYAIVSFPNFAHWHVRAALALYGRAPVTDHLPSTWYNTDRIRFLSVNDFEEFCRLVHANIVSRHFIGRRGVPIHRFRNWRTRQAIYVISKE